MSGRDVVGVSAMFGGNFEFSMRENFGPDPWVRFGPNLRNHAEGRSKKTTRAESPS